MRETPSISSPPGTSFRSAPHWGTTLVGFRRRRPPMRLLLKILPLQHLIIHLPLFSMPILWPKICSTMLFLLGFLDTTSSNSARLHWVAPLPAEAAMATSADNFMVFFLSNILLASSSFFTFLHIWSPFIQFLRNSCFSDDEPLILRLIIRKHQLWN